MTRRSPDAGPPASTGSLDMGVLLRQFEGSGNGCGRPVRCSSFAARTPASGSPFSVASRKNHAASAACPASDARSAEAGHHEGTDKDRADSARPRGLRRCTSGRSPRRCSGSLRNRRGIDQTTSNEPARQQLADRATRLRPNPWVRRRVIHRPLIS